MSAAAAPNPIMSFVPMIAIFAIFYFLVIRPQQRQASVLKQMLNDLKTGDRVLTQGGIYGVVAALRGDVVQLKIAENVKVEIARSAITQVTPNVANNVITPEVVGNPNS